MRTRVFKSGNSLAIRMPKKLRFLVEGQDVEVELIDNILVVRPVVKKTLADLGKILTSPSFMTEGREFHEEHERDWSGVFGDPKQG